MLTVTIYPAGGVFTRKKWRFTVRAANNEIIATSGKQSYYNKGDLFRTLHALFYPKGVDVRDLSDGTVTELREDYLREQP